MDFNTEQKVFFRPLVFEKINRKYRKAVEALKIVQGVPSTFRHHSRIVLLAGRQPLNIEKNIKIIDQHTTLHFSLY
jgi:hypothetical protein